jgi:hypothetical protein
MLGVFLERFWPRDCQNVPLTGAIKWLSMPFPNTAGVVLPFVITELHSQGL